MKITQYDKIIALCDDGNYHCQLEFWNNFIRSPHKRRQELEDQGKWQFLERKCEHGLHGSKDYKMIPQVRITLPPARIEQEKSLEKVKQLSLI